MGSNELGCIYAILIIHADGNPITAEKICTLLKAANVSVESYWPSLFAKLAQNRNVDDLVLNAPSGVVVAVAAPAAAGCGATDAAPTVEEKKEEPKEESDNEMGFRLFDD